MRCYYRSLTRVKYLLESFISKNFVCLRTDCKTCRAKPLRRHSLFSWSHSREGWKHSVEMYKARKQRQGTYIGMYLYTYTRKAAYVLTENVAHWRWCAVCRNGPWNITETFTLSPFLFLTCLCKKKERVTRSRFYKRKNIWEWEKRKGGQTLFSIAKCSLDISRWWISRVYFLK